MATLHPEIIQSTRSDGGLYREIDVIERLSQSLPDQYEIFHSVSWFSVHNSTDYHGEIDVIILNPDGNLLILEVKAGEVVLKDGEVFKLYSDKLSNVTRQTKIQYAAIRSRLHLAELNPIVTKCLVLPDYDISNINMVEYPNDRIIGAKEYDFLGTHIVKMFQNTHAQENIDAVRQFLMNEFKVIPDLGVIKNQVSTATQRLSEGMSTWVPRIQSPSGVIRIQATAGSGKTQLALQLLAEPSKTKQKRLYVCFNRSLIDHMAKIAPTNVQVTSFHELSIDYYQRQVSEPDFSDPEIFNKATSAYIAHIESQESKFDLIIIDEAQDFEPEWVGCLVNQLKSDGRLYLMEDQDQRVYKREEFDLEGAVTITSNENFRSPLAICQLINALKLATNPIDAKGPYKGDMPEFLVYQNEKQLFKLTEQAINELLARGFELSDIVVLTGRGQAKSKILNSSQIGKFSTKHFTGEYSENGDQIWVDGEVKTESIYRFKGQSAPAIVLTEIDFTELNITERNKLFVGLTRAQMAVDVVLSSSAENSLRSKI